MRIAVSSAVKPGIATWFPGCAGLYPNGLISAFFFNEAGFSGNSAGDNVVWDAVQQSPASLVALTASPTWTTGRGGPALNLVGSTKMDCLNLSRALDPKTWAYWILPTNNPCAIAAKNDANTVDQGWLLGIFSGGVQLLVEGNITRNMIVQTTNVPSDWATNWHHVVISWNGFTNSNSVVNIYIDGVLRANTFTQTDTSTGVYTSDAGQILRLFYSNGSGTDFNGQPLNAALESLLMFNRALQPDEVIGLFQASYRWYHRIVSAVSTTQQFTKTINAAMSTFAGSLTAQRTSGKTFNASMSTFAATLPKQTNKALSASMSTFSGAIAKFISVARATFNAAMSTFAGALTEGKIKTAVINAAMLQFAGRITKQVGKALTAGMSTFAATLTPQFIKGANIVTITASMATFAGALTFQSTKSFGASMSLFSATLSLVVTHGGVPPTCIPAACDTLTNIISHVEQCELEGS